MALFLLSANLGWVQGHFNFTETSLRYQIAYYPETANERKMIPVELTEDEQLYYANPKRVFKMHHPRKGEHLDLCPDRFALYKKKKI